MKEKVWAYKHRCVQCGRCCKNIVCDLGVIFLATTDIPCPALQFDGKKYWCGLITKTGEYVFPELGLTVKQYETIKNHLLKVNNFGEGCDFERWHTASTLDMPLISKVRAKKAVPTYDCSGKKLTHNEREDIARYILEGAEIQRDTILWGK